MKCSILSAESVSVGWFMTINIDDAGIDGIEIMEGVPFSIVPSQTEGNITFSSLVFLAKEDTFGYYWCEIMFPSMNKASSPVVAVTSNSSLPLCSDIAMPYDPPSNTSMGCAVEGLSVSEITSSLPSTPLYSTSTSEYSFSPSTVISEVPSTVPYNDTLPELVLDTVLYIKCSSATHSQQPANSQPEKWKNAPS